MFSYFSISRQGSRKYNEDCVKITQNNSGSLFLLADGLGGHGRGREASDAITEKSAEIFLSSPAPSLDECFLKSQDFLISEQIRLNAQNEMKSTFVLLHIADGIARAGHVGDSRYYHFRKSKPVYRSLDHSVPQMLVARGEIKESAIRGHEDRNRLIRVMGTEWNSPKYELHPVVRTESGDSFLLCSDGFWEYIDEKHMSKTLKRAKSPEEWIAAMEEIVLSNGKGQNMDNYSAVAVFIL